MLPISMSGQELILAGLEPTEIARFNELLRLMLDRVRSQGEYRAPTTD